MTAAEILDLAPARELVAAVERGGGTMALAGENIELFLPDGITHLLPDLKSHKVELLALLHRLGGSIAHFPACPQCGAYYLHRVGNVGPFECQRCGLAGIEEHAARIASFMKESKSPGRVM